MHRPASSRSRLVATGAALAVVGGLVVAQPAQAAPRPASPAPSRAATRALTPKLGPGGRVIVLLKNQTTAPTATTQRTRAAAQAGRSQVADVATRITRSGGTVTQRYSLINAVAARVTKSQARTIAADPAVKEVVADEPIRQSPEVSDAPRAGTSDSSGGIAPPANTCKRNGGVQLEPEALSATRANSDVPGAKTARSLGYTGKGVTVGWIADGLDVNNPNFIRNGKSIFTDYQDFGGDGTNAPTGGGEAFLDASAIAAQGKKVYDVSHFSALPLNQACRIRIEGEAPGVNLVGLNIFGSEDTGFNSSFVQAIQYSVETDHVNVLNESLGSNLYPDDSGSLDAVKAANDAAVAAGTTVTVSSGDAGVTSTIGTPATDPNVISVGASTTYRFFLQTGYGGARLPGIKGWISNNISSLSSGGFTQQGRTVDLVAPGELNYAVCSKDLTQYSECADYAGNPIGVEASGGTSESAPITAGVAALVIEAYRKAHGGDSPSPATVKTILTSTADDIQAPGDQQGAGLLDAYKAVELAKSYHSATRAGDTITSSRHAFFAAAAPNTTQHFTDTITNSGASTQTVSASARALGGYHRLRTSYVTLSDANSPKYVDFQGITDNVGKITFRVPAGENRLNASIAFKAVIANGLAARVRMDLVDPTGRLASYSLPQGLGNYGDCQVANPTPGVWTAWITSRESGTLGTEGRVNFAARAAKFRNFGRVSPSSVTLAPGQSKNVTLTTHTKLTPGDLAGALVLHTSKHEAGIPATSTVPVTMRALIPAGRQRFTDVLTGGNGRESVTGETFYYGIDVPKGAKDLNAYVKLPDDPTNQFYVKLINPAGSSVASGANNVLTSLVDGTPVGKYTLGAQAHAVAPAPGRWTLIVLFAPTVSGNNISKTFTVTTDQAPVQAAVRGLPTSSSSSSDTIASGTTRTVYVTVRNSGNSPEAYFVDPRLTTSSVQQLAPLTNPSTTVPLHFTSSIPEYLVPTRTTAIAAAAVTRGSRDIQFDVGAPTGDPDVLSNVGTRVQATYSSAQRVTQGVYSVYPTEVGPFPTAGPTETVDTGMAALTRDFDTSAAPSTGDLWRASVDPNTTLNTVTVQPGQTARIPVTIHATGKPRTVSGTMYVDDAQLFSLYGVLLPDGNELAALPYRYTITK